MNEIRNVNKMLPVPAEPTVREPLPPALRFNPTAWAKLLFLRDYGDTEVGGFGIAAGDDLLLVEDIQLVKQVCSWGNVAFDDASVADFFDRQVDACRRPEQFGRIWVHTHPGDSPEPSMVDEETFTRVFGRSQWAVMFILAREGQAYARLRFNVGPGAELEIPVGVDYERPFGGCAHDVWEHEYLLNVQRKHRAASAGLEAEPALEGLLAEEPGGPWYESWLEYADDGHNMEEPM